MFGLPISWTANRVSSFWRPGPLQAMSLLVNDVLGSPVKLYQCTQPRPIVTGQHDQALGSACQPHLVSGPNNAAGNCTADKCGLPRIRSPILTCATVGVDVQLLEARSALALGAGGLGPACPGARLWGSSRGRSRSRRARPPCSHTYAFCQGFTSTSNVAQLHPHCTLRLFGSPGQRQCHCLYPLRIQISSHLHQ